MALGKLQMHLKSGMQLIMCIRWNLSHLTEYVYHQCIQIHKKWTMQCCPIEQTFVRVILMASNQRWHILFSFSCHSVIFASSTEHFSIWHSVLLGTHHQTAVFPLIMISIWFCAVIFIINKKMKISIWAASLFFFKFQILLEIMWSCRFFCHLCHNGWCATPSGTQFTVLEPQSK